MNTRRYYSNIIKVVSVLLIAVFLVGCQPEVPKIVVFVDADTPATKAVQDGMSQNTAFATIQQGIDTASALGGGEVWVTAGTYDEVRPDDVDGSVVMRSGVVLLGGFDGTETSSDQRDWVRNAVIISGINGLATAEVAYHVVKGADDATLDGFTITGGYAVGLEYEQKQGGGMYNNDTSPTINNCDFVGNYARSFGGGIYSKFSEAIISTCSFNNNVTEGDGGGMFNFFSSPTILNCLFTENEALSAGAMANVQSSPLISNATFIRNTATYHAGGMANSRDSRPVLSSSAFIENSADLFGGGVVNDSSSPIVNDCIFTGNNASYGGGMVNLVDSRVSYISETVVSNCTFTGNMGNEGGGIWNANAPLRVSNSLFLGNASHLGGGIVNYNDSSSIISNCTFSGNTATRTGGGMINADSSPTVTNCIFWGDTAGESDPEINDSEMSAFFSFSCIEGVYSGTNMINDPPQFVGLVGSGVFEVISYDVATGQSTLTHTGQFDTDALVGLTLWVDLDNDNVPEAAFPVAANDVDTINVWGDAIASTTFAYDVWDYSLQSASPCIDTGQETSTPYYGTVIADILDVARPQDGDGIGAGTTGDGSDYDIGAYEYVPLN